MSTTSQRSYGQRFMEAQEWTQYLVNGEYVDRVRYGEEPKTYGKACPGCDVKKGHLHLLGCQYEWNFSPCGCSGAVTDCLCEAFLDEFDLERPQMDEICMETCA